MAARLDLADLEARLLELEMWATEMRLNLGNFEWAAAARLRSGGLEWMVILAVLERAAAAARLDELVMAVILNLSGLERERRDRDLTILDRRRLDFVDFASCQRN